MLINCRLDKKGRSADACGRWVMAVKGGFAKRNVNITEVTLDVADGDSYDLVSLFEGPNREGQILYSAKTPGALANAIAGDL